MSQTTPPPTHRERTKYVRYLVVLQALGQALARVMQQEGVSATTIESWHVYYDQLMLKSMTCKPSELAGVGQALGNSLKTALWYIREAGEQ
jgi:hypothetical protein